MVTQTKPKITTKPPEKKDWVTPLVVVGGTAAVGVGLWLFLRKPLGVSPGGKIQAHFEFDYAGIGGTYIAQVSLGIQYPLVFDHVEGLTQEWELDLPGPGPYKEDFTFLIPLATKPKKYDAEATIRTPDMDWLSYLIKYVTKGAITVR